MSETLFISDLHLDPARPEIFRLFSDFLRDRASQADALYILGDLFEYWIGDDQPKQGLEPLFSQLKILSQSVPIFVIHGNRDFLLGEQFSLETGIQVLPETIVVDLYGQPTLLMHGDELCTDDIKYQQLRQMLRNPQWQAQFLAFPLPERIRQAQELRDKSMEETGSKDESIMDVNTAAVASAFTEHKVQRLIHGHTHRPAIHDLELNGTSCQRIVLGDWYDQGSVLSISESSLDLSSLPL